MEVSPNVNKHDSQSASKLDVKNTKEEVRQVNGHIDKILQLTKDKGKETAKNNKQQDVALEECQNDQDIIDVYSLDDEEESIVDSSDLKELPKNKHHRTVFSKEKKVKEELTNWKNQLEIRKNKMFPPKRTEVLLLSTSLMMKKVPKIPRIVKNFQHSSFRRWHFPKQKWKNALKNT